MWRLLTLFSSLFFGWSRAPRRSGSANRRIDSPVSFQGAKRFMHEGIITSFLTRSRSKIQWQKIQKLRQKCAQLIQLRVRHGSNPIPRERQLFQVRPKRQVWQVKEIAVTLVQSTRHLLLHLRRGFSQDFPHPRLPQKPPRL